MLGSAECGRETAACRKADEGDRSVFVGEWKSIECEERLFQLGVLARDGGGLRRRRIVVRLACGERGGRAGVPEL
eukprot:263908-Rhodomonas_salina.1